MLQQGKDKTDFRPRGANSSSSRGGKGGGDRYAGRGGSNQFNSNGMWLLWCDCCTLYEIHYVMLIVLHAFSFPQSLVVSMVNLLIRRKMELLLIQAFHLLHLVCLEITQVVNLHPTG